MATQKFSLTAERRLLVDVLARSDAIFSLDRAKYDLRREQARIERQRAYIAGGIDFTAGGSVADRQASGRLLGDLESGRLLSIHRGAGRREGVRLTPLGDTVTRRLCGLRTVADVWPLLQLAGEYQAMAAGAAWPESLLVADEFSGTPDQIDRWTGVVLALRPLLTAGLIVAFGDRSVPVRRYWLRLTASGRAALDAGPPGESLDVEFCEAAAREYDRLLDRAEARLRDARPADPSDIPIPHPCGIGWGSLRAVQASWRIHADDVA